MDEMTDTHIDTGMTHKPGLYFDMPEEEYHAIPALSASGIKRLAISSMDFWVESWMNENYRIEETDALLNGRAYHKRLEGKEKFDAEYAPVFDDSDYPNALRTANEIKACLKDLKIKGYSTLVKDGLVQMLRDADPTVQIIDDLRTTYEEKNPGKTFLKRTVIDEIEIMATMIDNDPNALKCFRGGYSEVSVIWYDEKTGVPMKSRFDYLKTRSIVDLKTFSNPLGKTIDGAIASSMASRKYHVQAAVYCHADRQAVNFARNGMVHGDVNPAWLKEYAKQEQKMFVFVFQKTGAAPVTRVKPFSWKLITFKCGEDVMNDAINDFSINWEHYGAETPWLDIAPATSFTDECFPLYITEQ